MKATNVLAAIAEHPPATFLELVGFNDANFSACDITGVSPVWEMHPDTDEWFYVIEGTLEFTVLDAEETRLVTVAAGETFVVPRGLWHRPGAPGGAKFMFLTPGETRHSDAEDPRVDVGTAPKAL